MSKHVDIRRKIKEIPSTTSFNALIDGSTLSADDKLMLRMHYLEEKDFRYIGDVLGYSESTIKYRHRKALKKLGNLL